MEIIGWLLIAPVVALVAVLAGALLLLGVYALAVVGVAALLVAVHGAAGPGGLVVAGLCLLAAWVGALVVHRARSRRGATHTDDETPAPAAAVTDRDAVTAPAEAVQDRARYAPAPAPALPQPKGRCPVCKRTVGVAPARGLIKTHVTRGERCKCMGMAAESTRQAG